MEQQEIATEVNPVSAFLLYSHQEQWNHQEQDPDITKMLKLPRRTENIPRGEEHKLLHCQQTVTPQETVKGDRRAITSRDRISRVVEDSAIYRPESDETRYSRRYFALNTNRMLQVLRSPCYWVGIAKDVETFCKICSRCCMAKLLHVRSLGSADSLLAIRRGCHLFYMIRKSPKIFLKCIDHNGCVQRVLRSGSD